jgi:hypothetical protein
MENCFENYRQRNVTPIELKWLIKAYTETPDKSKFLTFLQNWWNKTTTANRNGISKPTSVRAGKRSRTILKK